MNTTKEYDWQKLMPRQTPVIWAETFPFGNTNGTRPRSHVIKENRQKNDEDDTLY